MAILKLKIIKRDWKLPNLSHFTYTSIVQCILQVLYSFWTCFTPKMAILMRLKNGNFEAVKTWQNGPFRSYFRLIPLQSKLRCEKDKIKPKEAGIEPFKNTTQVYITINYHFSLYSSSVRGFSTAENGLKIFFIAL